MIGYILLGIAAIFAIVMFVRNHKAIIDWFWGLVYAGWILLVLLWAILTSRAVAIGLIVGLTLIGTWFVILGI